MINFILNGWLACEVGDDRVGVFVACVVKVHRGHDGRPMAIRVRALSHQVQKLSVVPVRQ